jgi:hypothetical protein
LNPFVFPSLSLSLANNFDCIRFPQMLYPHALSSHIPLNAFSHLSTIPPLPDLWSYMDELYDINIIDIDWRFESTVYVPVFSHPKWLDLQLPNLIDMILVKQPTKPLNEVLCVSPPLLPPIIPPPQLIYLFTSPLSTSLPLYSSTVFPSYTLHPTPLLHYPSALLDLLLLDMSIYWVDVLHV